MEGSCHRFLSLNPRVHQLNLPCIMCLTHDLLLVWAIINSFCTTASTIPGCWKAGYNWESLWRPLQPSSREAFLSLHIQLKRHWEQLHQTFAFVKNEIYGSFWLCRPLSGSKDQKWLRYHCLEIPQRPSAKNGRDIPQFFHKNKRWRQNLYFFFALF